MNHNPYEQSYWDENRCSQCKQMYPGTRSDLLSKIEVVSDYDLPYYPFCTKKCEDDYYDTRANEASLITAAGLGIF